MREGEKAGAFWVEICRVMLRYALFYNEYTTVKKWVLKGIPYNEKNEITHFKCEKDCRFSGELFT